MPTQRPLTHPGSASRKAGLPRTVRARPASAGRACTWAGGPRAGKRSLPDGAGRERKALARCLASVEAKLDPRQLAGGIRTETARLKVDRAIGVLLGEGIVADHKHGASVPMKLREVAHHLCGVLRVEVAGRLVGQDD